MVVLKTNYSDGDIFYAGDDLSSDDSGLNLISKQINRTQFLPFGGDGSDGALTITSGTTNLNTNQWYQYSSISITGGTLSTASGGAGASGTLFIKCVGNMTFTGGTIDMSGLGAPAKTAGGMTSQAQGADGSDSNSGAAGAGGAQGAGTSELTYPTVLQENMLLGLGYNFPNFDTRRAGLITNIVAPGSGGGAGGAGNNGGYGGGGGGGGGSVTASGSNGTAGTGGGSPNQGWGVGGVGGGAIYIEVFGDINFGASATINLSGGNGTAQGDNGGGAGGGASGCGWIIVLGTITDAGTKTVTGGTGATGNGNGGNGGDGAAGTVQIESPFTLTLG